VLLENALTCLHLQLTKLSGAQELPTSWLGGSTRGLQPDCHVHKEAVHLQPASVTSSGAFKPECNDLSQFREDTGGPSMPVREFNLIACLLVQSSWKTITTFEPRLARVFSPSDQKALWPISVVWPTEPPRHTMNDEW